MAGRLVENQDLRTLEQGACNCQSLLFTTRWSVIPLTHHFVVAIAEPHDEIVDVCRACRRKHLILCCVGLGVQQVLPDTGMEGECILSHGINAHTQTVLRNVAQIVPIKHHPPFGGILGAGKEVRERRLADAARASGDHPLAGTDLERHVLQCLIGANEACLCLLVLVVGVA